MPLNTTYMLTHKQLINGQLCQNVYFYDHVAGTGTSDTIGEMFIDNVQDVINAIQTEYVTNLGLDVVNMGITTDFSIFSLVGAGDYTGDNLPPQDAVSYTFKSGDRAIRPGGKRYVGVPETVQNVGVIADETYLDKMETLRDLLGNNLILGGDTFQPVIVKRIKEEVVGTVPLQYTYRLPTTGDTFLSTNILSVLVSKAVSSQVSRKKK